MYQGYLYSVASQWSYRNMHLPPSGMDELIQTTPGMKLELDRSIFCDFGGGSSSMKMLQAVTIFDV